MNSIPEQVTVFLDDLSTANTVTINTGQFFHKHKNMTVKALSYSHIDGSALDTSLFEVTWNRSNKPVCHFATTVNTFEDNGSVAISSSATFQGKDVNTIYNTSEFGVTNITFTVEARGWGSLVGALMMTLEFV